MHGIAFCSNHRRVYSIIIKRGEKLGLIARVARVCLPLPVRLPLHEQTPRSCAAFRSSVCAHPSGFSSETSLLALDASFLSPLPCPCPCPRPHRGHSFRPIVAPLLCFYCCCLCCSPNRPFVGWQRERERERHACLQSAAPGRGRGPVIGGEASLALDGSTGPPRCRGSCRMPQCGWDTS
jgi:hypothetical protein